MEIVVKRFFSYLASSSPSFLADPGFPPFHVAIAPGLMSRLAQAILTGKQANLVHGMATLYLRLTWVCGINGIFIIAINGISL